MFDTRMIRHPLLGGPFVAYFAEDDPPPKPDDGQAGSGSSGGTGGRADEPTIKIKVDGSEKEISLDEARTLAEKASGADKRFQEAARTRQEAERAVKFYEAAQRADEDDEAFKEVGRMMGYSDEDLDEAVAARAALRNEEGARGSQGKQENQAPALTKDQEAALKAGQEARVQQKREEALGNIREALDKDDTLGHNKVEDQEMRDELFGLLLANVRNRLIETGESFGPDSVQASLQQLKRQVKRLGLFKEDNSDDTDAKVEKLRGLGVGIGETPQEIQGFKALVKEGKGPERVPVTDPNYAENFAQRLLLHQTKGG